MCIKSMLNMVNGFEEENEKFKEELSTLQNVKTRSNICGYMKINNESITTLQEWITTFEEMDSSDKTKYVGKLIDLCYWHCQGFEKAIDDKRYEMKRMKDGWFQNGELKALMKSKTKFKNLGKKFGGK